MELPSQRGRVRAQWTTLLRTGNAFAASELEAASQRLEELLAAAGDTFTPIYARAPPAEAPAVARAASDESGVDAPTVQRPAQRVRVRVRAAPARRRAGAALEIDVPVRAAPPSAAHARAEAPHASRASPRAY